MNKRKPGMRYLLLVYMVLVLVMFLLPQYSTAGYSILENTTSHLGAQGAPNAWIMNLVFALLGAAAILEAWLYLKGYWIHKILLTIFGLGLIGTAIFQHAPIYEGIPYNHFEDTMHSVFATTVGFSFTLFAISAAFIEITGKRRIVALLIAVMATVLSALMFTVTGFAGLFQRTMLIISFAWLILFLEAIRPEAESDQTQ